MEQKEELPTEEEVLPNDEAHQRVSAESRDRQIHSERRPIDRPKRYTSRKQYAGNHYPGNEPFRVPARSNNSIYAHGYRNHKPAFYANAGQRRKMYNQVPAIKREYISAVRQVQD